MKEQLISFETAKLAKEKKFFDETINGEVRISQQYVYDNQGNLHTLEQALYSSAFKLNDCYNAPTQSLLQKWLREVHNIIVTVAPFHNKGLNEDLEEEEFEYECLYSYFIHKRTKFIKDDVDFATYEETLEVGEQEALKLIK